MRTLAIGLLGLAACGGNSDSNTSTPVDAPMVKIIDAAPDAAPDAFIPPPIDAFVPPTYDFSCYQQALPTTAADPVHVSGSTEEIGLSGLTAAANLSIQTFKTGSPNAIDTTTSDASGTFMTGALVTGGTPLNGYVRASSGTASGATQYRTTYLYPPSPIAADLTGAPVSVVTPQTFSTLGSFLGGGTQDDTKNGALLVIVTDCAQTQIDGAALTVTQNGTAVGTVIDLGAASGQAQAAGLFFVYNVPAGTTNVAASYSGKTFLAHDVVAYKMDSTIDPNGTITLTNVRPGP
jgi:hypothetical protein